jgi:hypothetical protein
MAHASCSQLYRITEIHTSCKQLYTEDYRLGTLAVPNCKGVENGHTSYIQYRAHQLFIITYIEAEVGHTSRIQLYMSTDFANSCIQ